MARQYNITATVRDKKGRVLGIGRNDYAKTHPLMRHYNKNLNEEAIYLHAEVAAIIKALRNGKPYSIFVERYGKDGKPKLAKPCPVCEVAIKQAGIVVVSYTVG